MFGRKEKSKEKAKDAKGKDKHSGSNGPSPSTAPLPDNLQVSRPKLVFHCQQAHGSPTGVISEFTNVKELYQKIAECYDISSHQVIVNQLYRDTSVTVH